MDRNQLVELEVEAEGFKVRLKKKGEPTREVFSIPGLAGLGISSHGAPGGSPSSFAAGGPPSSPTESIPEENLIRAPMVGTLYFSSSPEADPFVEAGDRIEEGQVLCIIEAMKVMNEVKAEVSGTIEAVLAENGEPVEYGSPLFRIS